MTSSALYFWQKELVFKNAIVLVLAFFCALFASYVENVLYYGEIVPNVWLQRGATTLHGLGFNCSHS